MVIHFCFTDARSGERHWWLVVEKGVADLCRDDPGHDLTVVVECTVRSLTEIWAGDAQPAAEVAAGRMRIQGAGPGGRDLWRWIGRSIFAASRVARPQG